MFAMVLLPAPDRPVNQRQKPVRHGRGRLREGRAKGEIMEVLSHDSDYRRPRTRTLGSDRPRDACGVFGVYAPGQRGRARHLPRPLRAPAPRPGVGRHRGERRRDDHRRQGHGPRHAGVRRAPARAARRPPLDRARPLLDDRLEHVAQRAAGVPVGRRRRLRARPQRQPHQHRGAGATSSGCCRACSRPTAS